MAQWYIKEFSKLSNVSVRTLHHYDKINLLKPSIRLANGYRLYAETDLLRLGQILALKFFGFELSQVQMLLEKESDALAHFMKQRQSIQQQITQLQNANMTLEGIIDSLKHNRSIHWNQIIQLIEDYRMKPQTKMIWGPDLNADKQLSYQNELVAIGLATQAQIDECNLKTQSWSEEKVKSIKEEQDALLKAIAVLMTQGENPQANSVQNQISRHFETIKNFWTPDKESYKKLAQFYCEQPDFNQFLKSYHREMCDFLAKAMIFFAEQNLH